MRSNKDQGASGSRSPPKKGASDDQKRGRSKKRKRNHSKKHRRYSSTSSSSASESHSPERKRIKATVVKRGKNIAAKKANLLQMNQILKQILTPSLSKHFQRQISTNIICILRWLIMLTSNFIAM